MSVIPLTLFFSLLLAGLFIVLFARSQRRRFASAERDSLLPLADEQRHEVSAGPQTHEDHDHEHTPDHAHSHDHEHTPDHAHSHDHEHTPDHALEPDHDHADHPQAGGCGCKTGKRAPCAGCLKRTPAPTAPSLSFPTHSS